MLTYVSSINADLLFGGQDDSGYLDDTWLFQNGDWTELNPAHVPSPRAYGAIAPGARDYGAVIFGGENSTGFLSDTLEWQGGDWTTLALPGSPSARDAASMAVDPSDGATILFGGYAGDGPLQGFLGDTWEFQGSGWTQLSPQSSPSPRTAAVLAVGPNPLVGSGGQGSSGQIGAGALALVLYGGNGSSGGDQDTWVWSDDQWTELTTATSPDFMASSAGAYDVDTNSLLLATGNNPNYSTTDYTTGDTYSFNGSDWKQVATGATPPSAPSAPVATAGNGVVQLSWTAPTFSGGAPVTSFAIFGGDSAITVTGCPAPTSTTVTGLTNGFTYTFSVVADGPGGESSSSPPSNPVEPIGLPVAPSEVGAIGSDGSATVSWNVISNGGDQITDYQVTPSPPCSSCAGLFVKGSPPPTYTKIEGLTNGTPYTFSVTATSALGTSGASQPSAYALPSSATGPPTAPRNVQATFSADYATYVSFDPPESDGGSPVTSYTAMTTGVPLQSSLGNDDHTSSGSKESSGHVSSVTCTAPLCSSTWNPPKTQTSFYFLDANYYICVQATNANGNSGWSCTSNPVDTSVPYIPPYQPPSTPPETKTLDGVGNWQATSSGTVTGGGDNGTYGDASNLSLNAPIVALVATPDSGGYWLVGSDGGVFTFGDARYYGNPSQLDPARPAGGSNAVTLGASIVGLCVTTDGEGYWLVGADGGVFSFGDARFFGSASSIALDKPIAGMAVTPDGNGYWLVASDSGVFSFGDAGFFGSAGGKYLVQPVVGIAATPDGKGYCLVASDGTASTFGDAASLDPLGCLQANPIAEVTTR